MKLSFILLISFTVFLCCQATYMIGDQGESCNQACFRVGKNCNPVVITDNSFALFTEHGIVCEPDGKDWSDESQPCYVSDKKDSNYGKCLGFTNVPSALQCSESLSSVRRLCNCDDPASVPSFGTGYSGGQITTDEKWIFEYNLAQGDVGVLDHFWITYGTAVDNGTVVRYYIDGEKNASIVFTPSLACGVGFYDAQGPWGTKWFGKGADDAGWYNNFKIPFQKSIVVTVQHMYADFSGFYIIVRGSINIPIVIGGQVLPKTAKMNLNVLNDTYAPLAWVPLVNVSSGSGAHFMVTVAAISGNWVFLEGCVHAYFDGNNAFPGVVLSTGTEDYFDSAWYFNGGEFHLPVSGFTHSTQNDSMVTWSAYRFHDEDPLFWNDGFQLIWRNGDRIDPAGIKCYTIEGGIPVGSPTDGQILAYSWYYTW